MTNADDRQHADSSINSQRESSITSCNGIDNINFVHEEDIQCDNPVGNTWTRFEHFLSDAQSDSSQPRTDDVLNYSPPTEQTPKLQCRWRLRRVLESFPVRVFTLLCILADMSLVTTDLVISSIRTNTSDRLPSNSSLNASGDVVNELYRFPYELSDFILSSYFVVELLLRIIAHGLICFIQDWRNDVEIFIVFATFLLSVIDLITTDTPSSSKLKMLQVLRFIRIVRIIRLFTEKRHLERAARQMVSRNKRRYQEDGFDLDLTYVTDRVIAMSFPSTGKMSLYRNPIKEVAKFLDSKHLHCYKVYNLCSEQSYDASYFHGRVERYEIDDHNVPTVNQMVEFVKSVRFWLESGPRNVIAVHCKGGKGRTGTMICIWLVEAGLFQSAVDSLDYFGSRRTDTRVGRAFQGVETPSQSRYVAYYECIKENGGVIPPKRTLRLLKMTIEQISPLGKGDGSDFIIEVYVNRKTAPLFRADLGKQFHCQVYHMPSN